MFCTWVFTVSGERRQVQVHADLGDGPALWDGVTGTAELANHQQARIEREGLAKVLRVQGVVLHQDD